MLLAVAPGCSEKVSLGSLGAGASDADGGAGEQGCGLARGTPGPFNLEGDLGVTATYTDWAWPSAHDEVEADITLESDPAHDGYFWAYQFGFTGALGGFIGLQAHGRYQADPPSGPVEDARIAVFWIGGAPLSAQLGDIAYPRARTYLDTQRGTQWWTIHAKYEWTRCHTYRLRVAKQSSANGATWYAGYVHDLDSDQETYLGRISVPVAWGQLSRQGTSFSSRLAFSTLSACSDAEHTSAVFGVPSAQAGALSPSAPGSNRFDATLACASSRFSVLTSGVRHELAVPR